MISAAIQKLELRDVWTLSRNSSRIKDNIVVKLEKDGITGYGEAAPNVRYGEYAETTLVAIQKLSKALSEMDLSDHLQVQDCLDHVIGDQRCARAAVDMAVMDWTAKSRHMPLYRLLGLNRPAPFTTSYSIGIDTPDAVRRKTSRANDFAVLKIKVGGPDDEAMIRAVRSVTDKPIRVDANEGWADKETALRKIEWLQSEGVEFIEQPLPAGMLEETAWLKERVEIPIIADEAVLNAADVPALEGHYDGINIKLMKAGGIQEALKMIRAARRAGLKVMIGCMIESSLGITAAAHLLSLVDWADLDGHLLIRHDPFCGVTVTRGQLLLDDRPGIGATERQAMA